MKDLSGATAQGAHGIPFRSRDVLMMAAWFGLVVGLLEAVFYLVLQFTGVLAWNAKSIAVDQNILWASPLMDLMVFVGMGVVLLAVFRATRPARWLFATVAIFGAMACYALTSVPGRLRGYGTITLALGVGVTLARGFSRNPAAWMHRIRRSLRALVPVAIVIGIAAACGDMAWEKLALSRLPAPPAGAPNVLVIVMDTMRRDRLGTYGYSRPTTPFLDSFAGKSVLFENAFANAPWTLPSHVTFFTGAMPFEHGATLEPFDGRVQTIAQAMAARGYATVGIVANNSIPTRQFGVARGFQRYENIFTDPQDVAARTLYGRKFLQKVVAPFLLQPIPRNRMKAADVNRRFLKWLAQRPKRPFFAFLNYMEMHMPSNPAEEFVQKFAKDPPRLGFGALVHQHPMDREELRRLNDLYDAMAAGLDAELKRLFDELEKRGEQKNLLVIILSDHGEALGEHELIGHGIGLYMEEIRVPLMLRMQGKTPEGMRVADPVSLHALPATIMEMTGGKPGEFPGQSLSRCWTEGNCGEPTILSEVSKGFSPVQEIHWPTWQGWVKSLLAGQWHLIVQQDGKVQLYDWHRDPSEAQDLAGAEENRNVVRGLIEKLEAWVPEARERAAPYTAAKRR